MLTDWQRLWLRITVILAVIGLVWALWHFVIASTLSPNYITTEETTWITTTP